MANFKTIVGVHGPGSTHWVGDGFPVRNLFPSNGVSEDVNPFLMLDYAGPTAFGPGDVQWMTAASGVVHEEKHERAFARQGGTFEMVQLWVNLPRAHKMSA